jgi:hypothetical protein
MAPQTAVQEKTQVGTRERTMAPQAAVRAGTRERTQVGTREDLAQGP